MSATAWIAFAAFLFCDFWFYFNASRDRIGLVIFWGFWTFTFGLMHLAIRGGAL